MILDFQHAYEGKAFVPGAASIERWLKAALHAAQYAATLAGEQATSTPEITVRIVENSEIQQLNRDYRQQDKPTNVLSFPSELPDIPPGFEHSELAEALSCEPFLGDIVIAADIVQSEATAQNKPCEAHWAHMTAHGALHLLGFDHIQEDEACTMEALETEILVAMGYAPPYKE